MRFRLRSDTMKDEESQEPLYWSNELGWVNKYDGTLFTYEETGTFSCVLMGGTWEPNTEAGKYPTVRFAEPDSWPGFVAALQHLRRMRVRVIGTDGRGTYTGILSDATADKITLRMDARNGVSYIYLPWEYVKAVKVVL